MLLSALRDCARNSPATAAPGIARSIIHPHRERLQGPDHADIADALEAMRDERLVLAHAVHCAPGAHQ
ncbi:hypothetical protein (plasmid) [Streptomyces leeuwenhoekii]|uniref:Uncharacterized protein n=1 Tax=Streptomyces leeuwenhoekii TaxID=1437453 RepID=A0A0F7VMP3_STRLW|nr:hypothetical protein [Streptomyces leeuwenhoekii]